MAYIGVARSGRRQVLEGTGTGGERPRSRGSSGMRQTVGGTDIGEAGARVPSNGGGSGNVEQALVGGRGGRDV